MDWEVGRKARRRASCGKLQGPESEWGAMPSMFPPPLPDKEALTVAPEEDSAPGLRQRPENEGTWARNANTCKSMSRQGHESG